MNNYNSRASVFARKDGTHRWVLRCTFPLSGSYVLKKTLQIRCVTGHSVGEHALDIKGVVKFLMVTSQNPHALIPPPPPCNVCLLNKANRQIHFEFILPYFKMSKKIVRISKNTCEIKH